MKVWRPDATIEYLQGKHIAIFVTALVLCMIHLVYSTLPFCWQWLVYIPSWRVLNWTRNQKLQAFIETYHAPYVNKYGYWTGMLLFVRTVLYLTTVVNVSNIPQVMLVSVIFTVALVKGFIGWLYQKWPIDILETFFYFNRLALSIFTCYFLDRIDACCIHLHHYHLCSTCGHHPLSHIHIHYTSFTKLGQRVSTAAVLLHSSYKSNRKNQSPPTT